MGKRPTVYDVAQRAGVSIATVSFAFSQPHRVKPATLELVLAAADELGYIPSGNARGLAKGKTGAIGLYAFDYLLDESFDVRGDGAPAAVEGDPRLFPLYVDEVQRGVQLQCWDRGYALMIGGERQVGHTPAVTHIAGRVDGLVCFAGALDLEVVRALAGRLPVVELGGTVRVEGTRTVVVDNRSGMRDLVTHLVQRHGHRDVRYFGQRPTREFEDRYAGYVDAMGAAGLVPSPVWDSRPGYAATTLASLERCLAQGVPDAVVCSTDQEALVVLDRLRVLGLDVPGRVAVTGFDGIVAAHLADPALTTVRQPMERIGRAAVREVVALMTGEDAGRADLVAELVVGRSCGC